MLRDLKGFVEKNEGKFYLTLVFKDNCNECYENVRRVVKKLVGTDDLSKDYYVAEFEFESSDDVRGMIDISRVALVIRAVLVDGCYYLQIYLNYCEYEQL